VERLCVDAGFCLKESAQFIKRNKYRPHHNTRRSNQNREKWEDFGERTLEGIRHESCRLPHGITELVDAAACTACNSRMVMRVMKL